MATRRTKTEVEAATVPKTGWRGRLRMPKITLALSAFIMSLSVTLINAYYALRGPEVTLLPSAKLFLYRDGEGPDSNLMAAISLSMVNSSSTYGDVILDAGIDMPDKARFAWHGLVTPVMLADPAIAASKCPVDARCISHDGLTLIQLPDEIPELAAGKALQRSFVFALMASNCSGSKSACTRYRDFNRALQAISEKPLDIVLHVKFHADGQRTLRCRRPLIARDYVADVGWSSITCRTVTVRGGGLF